MKVLVTGASGFLGSHVAEQLMQQGHAVRCLVRASSNTKFLAKLGVELVHGAVDSPGTLADAVRGVDAVIHCAGITKARDEAEYDRVNHQGVRHLLEAVMQHAPGIQRFVHVSSAGVMGPCDATGVHTSQGEPRPVSGYGRSKLAGERVALEYKDKLPIVILRPPMVYGPRDTEALAIFRIVRTHVVTRLAGGFKRMVMIYGPDAAAACVRALTADVPSGSIYFLDDGGVWAFDEFIDAVAHAMDVKLWARPVIPLPVLKLAARVSDGYGRAFNKLTVFNSDRLNELAIQHFVCDAKPAHAALGWTPQVGLAEGMKLTARWYRDNAWL